MGQIVGLKAKPKRCNLNKLSQLGTPAAGEYILVSYDNSMTANGQGNFDRYIIGDGRTAATALELKYLDDSTRPYIVEEVNKAVADIQPIEITGDVTNAPDEEDLTSENQGGTDVLKFKDKAYNYALYSGLGRVYLRKNIVTLEGTGKNVLTQAMVNTANTIYHIQYDYDLNGQTITLPAGCVLQFEGGSIKNGIINGNETSINAGFVKIFGADVSLTGTWGCKCGKIEWFDGDFNKCLNYFHGIELCREKTYIINESVVFPFSAFIEGNNAVVKPSSTVDKVFVLGYSSVVKNLTVICENKASTIFDISLDNLSATYDNRDYYHISTGIFVSNVKMLTTTSSTIEDGTSAISIYADSSSLSGFWGVHFTNINITGNWEYGIDFHAGASKWITGCTFDNFFCSWIQTFLNVSGHSCKEIGRIVFNRIQVQHSSTTQWFARLANCSNIMFNDCEPWDWTSAAFEIDDATCENITLNNTDNFSSNPNEISINKGTTFPSRAILLSTSDKGRIEQYIDFSLYDGTTTFVPKSEFVKLPEGEYLFTAINATVKKLGMLPAVIRFHSGGFQDGKMRISHVMARTFIEVFGFGFCQSALASFLNSSADGKVEWFYGSQTLLLSNTEFANLTSVVKGQFLIVGGKLAYSDSVNIYEIRGCDGAKFLTTTRYSQTKILNLAKGLANPGFYYENKHLINSSTEREVIFTNGAWRDYDGVDITTRRVGSTSERPAASAIYIGFQYFDTTLGRPVFWDGTGWVDSSAIKIVEHGTSDTTYALTPNVFHIWGEVGSLTLTLASGINGILNEYNFQFNSGSTPTTISLPNTIKWAQQFIPEANKTYQVSIVNGIGVFIGV